MSYMLMVFIVSASSKVKFNNFIRISSIYLVYELRYSIVLFFGLSYLISLEATPIVQLAVKADKKIPYKSSLSFGALSLIELQN